MKYSNSTINKITKSFLSKLNFVFGRNPSIEKDGYYWKFIPKPYRAVITITADFELAWASRYTKSSSNPYQKATENARRARKNIPIILDLCDKYSIPITWATVGHLFLYKCEKSNGIPHSGIPRLRHFENDFWKFYGDDWFEYDPCSNYKDAPEWYCPDLIKLIMNAKVNHEIGCHTFSHIDCSDNICPSDVFKSEILECKKLAQRNGIELKSFVHPGHTIGNLQLLKNLGFYSYQTDYQNTLGYPHKHNTGLWELKRTMEFAYRPEWSIKYHIYRYKKIIDRAINSKTICNFWFHPSMNSKFVEDVMPKLFEYIDSNRAKVLISTVGDYVSWLIKSEDE